MTEPKRRAPRGTGSIVTRDGKTYAQWSSKDPQTGARKQHRAGPFKDERAARKHLTAQLGKIDAGTFVAPPKPITVGHLLDAWLASRAEIRATTRASYTVTIEKWLRPQLGTVMVAALAPAQVRSVLADLADHGGRGGRKLSPRSCQLALVTLRAALNWGVTEGTVVRNVAAGVKAPRSRSTMKSWTAEQARAFLAAIADDRLVALYALALTRGPRRGELCGLKWDQVDLEAGSMTIVETIVLVDGRPEASTPKTAAGVRNVPLDPALVKVLKAHRARQHADRLKAGSGWTDSGHVFTDEAGVALHPDHVSSRFEKLCGEAQVPPIRLHDARHSAASIMLASGVPVKVVSEMLGHGDVRITLGIYQHVLPGMSADAGAALSALVL